MELVQQDFIYIRSRHGAIKFPLVRNTPLEVNNLGLVTSGSENFFWPSYCRHVSDGAASTNNNSRQETVTFAFIFTFKKMTSHFFNIAKT